MKTVIEQSNLTAGELSPAMGARIDHEIYYKGLAKAQNVVIMPHGGVRRRAGLTKIEDSLMVGDGKMFSFEFSITQDYLIYMRDLYVDIYRDGELQVSLPTPYTLTQVKEVDSAQGGDVIIFTHEDHPPKFLRRTGSHTSWEFIDAPLSNIPDFDFGQGDEPVWSTTRGYPSVCTFFQSRLWFAGSKQRPSSVWASKINSFYDFDIGTGQPDFGMFDTIDSDQFNQITNIYPARNLMVFTANAEFYNVAEFITAETSAWKRSTGYGAKRMRPLLLDGSVIFTDRIGRTVRQTVFEYTEDAYVSPSISLVSDHLITDVVSMDAVKGTNIDVSDFVYVVNADGTIAVLNTIRSENLQGWTQWTTQGDFCDVCVVNKIVYFLVKRGEEYHIEYMNEGTTLDHNTVKVGVGLTDISVGVTAGILNEPHKLLLDNSVMNDIVIPLNGVVTFPRPANKVEVGLDVKLVVRTMALTAQMQEGVSLNMRKRVIRVMLNMKDSLGVKAFDLLAPDRQFTITLDERPTLFTGLKEIYILGYNRVTEIEITQDDPLPFKLLGIGYEVEV